MSTEDLQEQLNKIQEQKQALEEQANKIIEEGKEEALDKIKELVQQFAITKSEMTKKGIIKKTTSRKKATKTVSDEKK